MRIAVRWTLMKMRNWAFLSAAVYIASLLFLSSSCQASGILVIGDSISAQPDSWPAVIRESTGKHIMVMAQNGRTARDFTLPADLRSDSNMDTAIYLLGANDALQRTRPALFAERVLTQLRFLKDRGFRVLVVLVPEFADRESDVIKINKILIRKANGLKLEIVDLMPVWDNRLTYDTIHPVPALSRQIATVIKETL